MAFLITCTNRGCGQIQSAFIDKDTNEVYCSICDGIIENVSPFTKKQMQFLKQYRPKRKETFAVKCDKCNAEGAPQVINDQIVCRHCSSPLDNLSEFFKTMLKTQLAKGE